MSAPSILLSSSRAKPELRSDNKKKKLVAIIANLADYSLGATKGGEIAHFTQFDIDFNQEKSLLETRCSGALTRVYAAIVVEEDVTTASSDTSTSGHSKFSGLILEGENSKWQSFTEQ